MCLILFHFDPDGEYPLTVLANRDEFHARKTRQAGFWDDDPAILAGRDLEKGGTWMGVSRSGRFAAVTNYRSPQDMQSGGASRGALPQRFLAGREDAMAYASSVHQEGARYTGFNLLVYDGKRLVYVSNRSPEGVVNVASGYHGLSNALLDTPWPKVTEGVEALRASISNGDPSQDWLSIMGNTDRAEDALLPDTGIGLEKERQLSSRCIDSPGYGTRCSSFVRFNRNGTIRFVERTLIPSGVSPDTVDFTLRMA